MSTLSEVFAHCREQDRAALICYLPAGYPTVQVATQAMAAAIQAGADVIEVGVPYSDPLMDGPVIQEAVQASLRGGTCMEHVMQTVRDLQPVIAAQQRPVGVVLMSYWNPIEQYGVSRMAMQVAQAGGSGVITPDLIPDEAAEWISLADQQGVAHIFLVAPSSNSARLQMTVGSCTGFVYAASTMGVTGTRAQVGQAAHELVQRTRRFADPVNLPVCVGLGVSTPQQAAQVADFADGVIVGSALVKFLVERTQAGTPQKGPDAVGHLTGQLARAVSRQHG